MRERQFLIPNRARDLLYRGPSREEVPSHFSLLTSYLTGMLFYVAIGSALGGVSRYLLGGLVQRMLDTTFPAGTLFVNISGSVLLGAILRYAVDTPSLTPEVRALLTIGFCGGYTTFSTFSYETVALLRDGEWTRAGFYVAASVLLSIAGTFLGFGLAREVIAWRTRI